MERCQIFLRNIPGRIKGLDNLVEGFPAAKISRQDNSGAGQHGITVTGDFPGVSGTVVRHIFVTGHVLRHAGRVHRGGMFACPGRTVLNPGCRNSDQKQNSQRDDLPNSFHKKKGIRCLQNLSTLIFPAATSGSHVFRTHRK